jgi:uncharacterized protein (DUF2336 family)
VSVVTEQNKLSSADVASLLKDPSAENRALTAGKLGTQFAGGGLSASERAMAEEIFRLMVRDVETKVRASLAHSIKFSDDLPRDVALSLANDVAEVAIPVIEASSVLTDDDLLAIIASKPADYQVAVASRPAVSETVADALVETGDALVVTRLVNNGGAQLSETTMATVLDSFGHLPQVSNPMAQREVLPLKIAERLVSLVSDKIRDHLVTHHELSPDMAMDLVLDTRERATLHLLDGGSDAPDVYELVDQLHRNKRLSPTIIIRALCLGDLTFFEAALAKRAGVPVANVYQLIHDKGDMGLKRLFERSGMPIEALGLVRSAMQIAEELQMTVADRGELQRCMVERILTTFESDDGIEDMDYLIARLAGRKSPTEMRAA